MQKICNIVTLLCLLLCYCLNYFCWSVDRYIPNVFKRSYTVPIDKDCRTRAMSLDDFRDIAISTPGVATTSRRVNRACPTRLWLFCCWRKLWITMSTIADAAISSSRHVCIIDAVWHISTTYTMLMMLALMLVMMSIGIRWRSVHFHAADSIIIISSSSSSSSS